MNQSKATYEYEEYGSYDDQTEKETQQVEEDGWIDPDWSFSSGDSFYERYRGWIDNAVATEYNGNVREADTVPYTSNFMFRWGDYKSDDVSSGDSSYEEQYSYCFQSEVHTSFNESLARTMSTASTKSSHEIEFIRNRRRYNRHGPKSRLSSRSYENPVVRSKIGIPDEKCPELKGRFYPLTRRNLKRIGTCRHGNVSQQDKKTLIEAVPADDAGDLVRYASMSGIDRFHFHKNNNTNGIWWADQKNKDVTDIVKKTLLRIPQKSTPKRAQSGCQTESYLDAEHDNVRRQLDAFIFATDDDSSFQHHHPAVKKFEMHCHYLAQDKLPKTMIRRGPNVFPVGDDVCANAPNRSDSCESDTPPAVERDSKQDVARRRFDRFSKRSRKHANRKGHVHSDHVVASVDGSLWQRSESSDEVDENVGVCPLVSEIQAATSLIDKELLPQKSLYAHDPIETDKALKLLLLKMKDDEFVATIPRNLLPIGNDHPSWPCHTFDSRRWKGRTSKPIGHLTPYGRLSAWQAVDWTRMDTVGHLDGGDPLVMDEHPREIEKTSNKKKNAVGGKRPWEGSVLYHCLLYSFFPADNVTGPQVVQGRSCIKRNRITTMKAAAERAELEFLVFAKHCGAHRMIKFGTPQDEDRNLDLAIQAITEELYRHSVYRYLANKRWKAIKKEMKASPCKLAVTEDAKMDINRVEVGDNVEDLDDVRYLPSTSSSGNDPKNSGKCFIRFPLPPSILPYGQAYLQSPHDAISPLLRQSLTPSTEVFHQPDNVYAESYTPKERFASKPKPKTTNNSRGGRMGARGKGRGRGVRRGAKR